MIRFEVSTHHPDASFGHEEAMYPGVIIEVAYSQKRKNLYRLAEDYLLKSDNSIRAVIGLDIEYGTPGSRKATLSVWRADIFGVGENAKMEVYAEVEDEVGNLHHDFVVNMLTWRQVFRDELGIATNHTGLQLQLSDFAYEELVDSELGDVDAPITISAQQLCKFLVEAETKSKQARTGGKHRVAPGVRKRRRSETPPEEIAKADEERYKNQEQKVVRRMESQDPAYKGAHTLSSGQRPKTRSRSAQQGHSE
jgi:hypothetical protein